MFSLIFFHWDDIYNFLHIKEFIYFISSPTIQETLFPVKIVFIFFTAFFFCAVIWFYVNSSYIQYQFLQDASEFFSKRTYGLSKITKSWRKIKKRIDSGTEAELKLAIIEADDYLYETLQDKGYNGDTFEELIGNADKKAVPDMEELIQAHQIRNYIVYDPDYKLDKQQIKKILSVYENSFKNISLN